MDQDGECRPGLMGKGENTGGTRTAHAASVRSKRLPTPELPCLR